MAIEPTIKNFFYKLSDNWQDGYWLVVCNVQFFFSFRQNFSSFEKLGEKTNLAKDLFINSRVLWPRYVSWDVIPSNAVGIFKFLNDFRYLVNGFDENYLTLYHPHSSQFGFRSGAKH